MRLFIGAGEEFKVDQYGTTQRFMPGEKVMDETVAGKVIGILTEGIAKTSLVHHDGKERLISFMNPVSIFGEVAVLAGKKFESYLSLKAITPVTVTFMTKDQLENLIYEDPRKAFFLLKASSEKTASLISLLNGSYFQDTLTLVSSVLLNLGNYFGKEIQISHGEIAEIVDRNRVTVSNTLKKLQERGVIKQKKRLITVCDFTYLKEVAEM
jgi:CRP-like cAMP-binding protein